MLQCAARAIEDYTMPCKAFKRLAFYTPLLRGARENFWIARPTLEDTTYDPIGQLQSISKFTIIR